MIAIDKLIADIQPRVETKQEVIDEYAELLLSGVQMPPITVFYDKETGQFYLADGYHRVAAARQAGLAQIYEEIIPGTRRDAILCGLKANAKHGLRRSNADKRRAVLTMLNDAEWAGWSDNAIAKACAVDHKTVAACRPSLGNSQVSEPATDKTFTTKHGTTATMNTANIGATRIRRNTNVADDSGADIDEARPETAISEVDELRSRLCEMATSLEEVTADRDRLEEIIGADDRLTEIKRLSDLNRAIEARVAGLMEEAKEANQRAASWKKKATTAEAELLKAVPA